MPEENLDQIEDIMANRRIARKAMNDAASRGDPIAGMAEAMEHLAAPYFLGLEEDSDDTDMAVFP